MIDALKGWWSGLSQREQVLVSIAGALAGGLIGWFLILLPLQNALASAAEAHAAAIDRAAAVRSRIAALEAAASSNGAPSTAVVAQVVTQAAAEAGLPLARNDPAGNDGAAIAISNGRSAAVLTMLATLERQRIHASDLAIRPNGDGSINLTATLRRGGA
jgi:general secretion pathway protein M